MSCLTFYDSIGSRGIEELVNRRGRHTGNDQRGNSAGIAEPLACDNLIDGPAFADVDVDKTVNQILSRFRDVWWQKIFAVHDLC